MFDIDRSWFILKRVSRSELKLHRGHVLTSATIMSNLNPTAKALAELQSEIVKKYPLSTFWNCTALIQSRLPLLSKNSSPPWLFCGGNIFVLDEEQLLLIYTVMDCVQYYLADMIGYLAAMS